MAKAKRQAPKSDPLETEDQSSVDVTITSDEGVTEQVAQAMSEQPATDIAASTVGKTALQADQTEMAPQAEEVELSTEQTPVASAELVEDEQNNLKKSPAKKKEIPKKTWWQTALIATGLGLTLLIFVAGGFAQLYKAKVLPNVSVAGVPSAGENQQAVQMQVDEQTKALSINLQSGKTVLRPTQKEIGFEVDTEKTAEAAIAAKRSGLVSRFLFWKKVEVPAVVSVNDTLLAQYLENKLPTLTKAGQDAQLVYDPAQASFKVTTEKNGSGPDVVAVRRQLTAAADHLNSSKINVKTTNKPAKITKEKLADLVAPANEIVTTSIVLQGSAGTFQAQPADIAVWITPTPQKDGTIKLVIDPAKVQSYVESIGQQIASAPQDKKVIKDKKTGKQVVLQEGRDGTQLSDAGGLAAQITEAIKSGQGVTLQMNIKTAKAKTINLEGYDKWVEVDLTKQTATAYERATPLKSFVVATGLPGHETPTGEYAIYLKVRSQTMTGGSKADGSYYNLPNVEWVSYFYQDYALHGAWWRKVWGVPGSHGCVNMTNADAQWVYNWAPIGTKVIVHY